jgi:hypothetical protein
MDCRVKPGNDAWGIILAMHPHPSWLHDSNEKLRTLPTLCANLRQMTPAVVTGAVTICASSHA